MKSITHRLVGENSTVWTIYPIFDIHYGSVACNVKRLKADVQAIADDPYALFFLGGDMLEAIDYLDPRYDPLAQKIHSVKRQATDLADMFAPIRHKCLAIYQGNHEFMFTIKRNANAYNDFCEELARRDCPADSDGETIRKAGARLAMGVQGYIRLQFTTDTHGKSAVRTLTIWAEHGSGGGAMAGGDALMLERLLGRHACEVALCGHRHVVHPLKRNGDRLDKNGDVQVYKRWGAICGAYLEPFLPHDESGYPVDSYAERKHKAPIDAESWVRLKVRPHSGHEKKLSYWLETG